MTAAEKKLTTSMTAMLDFPPEPLDSTPLTVRRCLLAMTAEGDRAIADGCSAAERRQRTRMAYKLYMPALSDKASIQAYIACVAHGINLGVFTGRDASQMLYAAQVALQLVKQTTPPGRPRLAARPAGKQAAA
jgi:hypothetical protein